MIMVWFIPVGLAIGIAGTHTARKSRHVMNAKTKEKAWWLLVFLSWLPSFCWLLAQFIDQY